MTCDHEGGDNGVINDSSVITITIHSLLRELVSSAHKCSQIARHFRENANFRKLIQEKVEGKNPRFERDFKTLADVLIQQATGYWLDKKFPGLGKSIYGEESNRFTDFVNNRTIILDIDNDSGRLKNILEELLSDPNNNNGNNDDSDKQSNFIDALLKIIYDPESSPEPEMDSLLSSVSSPTVPMSRIALWIDPIDSTSEYIRGVPPVDDLAEPGLHCVTCLFGVFDKLTGLPVMGVVSQPFPVEGSSGAVWGYRIGEQRLCSLSGSSSGGQRSLPVLVGRHESPSVLDRISRLGEPLYVSGAGHKLLLVIQRRCQSLITSSRTTFFWDTCAGHAILLSLGGGIVPFDDLHEPNDPEQLLERQIRYTEKSANIKEYNNPGGLIAYRSVEEFNKLLRIFRT